MEMKDLDKVCLLYTSLEAEKADAIRMAKKAAIEASKRNKIHEEQDILGTKKKIQSNLLRK